MATGDYSGIYKVDPRLVALDVGVVAGDGIVSKTRKSASATSATASEHDSHRRVGREAELVPSRPAREQPAGVHERRARRRLVPAREQIPSFSGSSADGATFPSTTAINATNGQLVSSYPDPYMGTDGTGAVYGFHSGGVNVLLGDGSERSSANPSTCEPSRERHARWR